MVRTRLRSHETRKNVIFYLGKSKKEDKYVSINVKPGWKSGTKVTFQKEGDQIPGKIPSDIVFIIRDKPHPLYRREGSDLRFTARLTLKQVSNCIKLINSLK